MPRWAVGHSLFMSTRVVTVSLVVNPKKAKATFLGVASLLGAEAARGISWFAC
jgi:hypothetical protein